MFKSEESPMVALLDPALTPHKLDIDQCAFGAGIDGHFIQKASEIHSNRDLSTVSAAMRPDQQLTCDRSHEHLHLRGSRNGHALTSQAAVYPHSLCEWLLAVYSAEAEPPNGGSVGISSHMQYQIRQQPTNNTTKPANFEKQCRSVDSFAECLEVVSLLISELKVLAKKQGLGRNWEVIVEPWLAQYPQMVLPELGPDPSLHLVLSASTAAAQTAAAVQNAAQKNDDPDIKTMMTTMQQMLRKSEALLDQIQGGLQPARLVVERPRATIAQRAAAGFPEENEEVPREPFTPDAAAAEGAAASGGDTEQQAAAQSQEFHRARSKTCSAGRSGTRRGSTAAMRRGTPHGWQPLNGNTATGDAPIPCWASRVWTFQGRMSPLRGSEQRLGLGPGNTSVS